VKDEVTAVDEALPLGVAVFLSPGAAAFMVAAECVSLR
jgi:hypothetical protein